MSACCARCGEPKSLSDWRGKILLCESCWPVVEDWALDREYLVRRLVSLNDAARDRLERGTGYY